GMLEMLRVIREQEPTRPSTKLSTADGLPTLAANRGTEPAKLTKLLRGELDWIVMKALEKDRNHRYETANGFAGDVERYLADEPVLACPPSVAYRLRKFARKHRQRLALAAALVLALFAILGTGLWYYFERTQQQTERAIHQSYLAKEVTAALDEAEQIVQELHRKLADPKEVATFFSNLEPWEQLLDRSQSALRRAVALAGSSKEPLAEGLITRLAALEEQQKADQRDLAMAKKLDAIRLAASTLIEGKFHTATAWPKYQAEFTRVGLDFTAATP